MNLQEVLKGLFSKFLGRNLLYAKKETGTARLWPLVPITSLNHLDSWIRRRIAPFWLLAILVELLLHQQGSFVESFPLWR